MSLFLWLLTPAEENQKKTSKLQEEKRRESTYQRVGREGRRRASEGGNVGRESEEKTSEEIKISKERRGNGLPRESQRGGVGGGCPPIVEEAPLKSNHGNTPEHLSSQTTTGRHSTPESDTSDLDTATPYRKRTNAFTSSDRVISVSDKPVVRRRGEAETITHSRQSLILSSSWNQEEQSDEIWRTVGVVTETIGYMLWRSPDYNDIPPWKVCFENGFHYIFIYFHFRFRCGGNSFHLWTILRLSMLSLSQPTP